MRKAILDLLPRRHYPFRYAIVVGAKLDDDIINGIEKGPTIEYLDLYNRTNDDLNNLVLKIANFLQSKDIENKYVVATIEDSELDDEYWKHFRYKYSHKMAATRAGVGWIGKTDLLVSEKFGPRIRLTSVLTNYKFENPGNPITGSRCGDCVI